MHDEVQSDDQVPANSSDSLSSQLIQLFRENAVGIEHGIKRLRDALRPLFDVEDLAVAIPPGPNGGPPQWQSLRQISAANEERQLEIFFSV